MNINNHIVDNYLLLSTPYQGADLCELAIAILQLIQPHPRKIRFSVEF